MRTCYLLIAVVLAALGCSGPEVAVTGELKLWHTVTLTFPGPETSEAPNRIPSRLMSSTSN